MALVLDLPIVVLDLRGLIEMWVQSIAWADGMVLHLPLWWFLIYLKIYRVVVLLVPYLNIVLLDHLSLVRWGQFGRKFLS